VAKKRGITGMTAMVMLQNHQMMNMLHKTGYKIKTRKEEDAYEVRFRFDEREER